jgi:hypothetical protein
MFMGGPLCTTFHIYRGGRGELAKYAWGRTRQLVVQSDLILIREKLIARLAFEKPYRMGPSFITKRCTRPTSSSRSRQWVSPKVQSCSRDKPSRQSLALVQLPTRQIARGSRSCERLDRPHGPPPAESASRRHCGSALEQARSGHRRIHWPHNKSSGTKTPQALGRV